MNRVRISSRIGGKKSWKIVSPGREGTLGHPKVNIFCSVKFKIMYQASSCKVILNFLIFILLIFLNSILIDLYIVHIMP